MSTVCSSMSMAKLTLPLPFFFLFIVGCATTPEKYHATAPEEYYYVCKQPQTGNETAIINPPKTEYVCTQNTAGTAGGGTQFAQSFVPRCEVIKALELAVYPVQDTGWLKVTIANDENGAPGKVLLRSSVRVEKNCPVPHGGFMTFPLGNLKVDPDGIYWITCVEQADGGGGTVSNFGFSQTDTYPEGRLIYGNQNGDARFRILGEFNSPLWLSPASQNKIQPEPTTSSGTLPWESNQKRKASLGHPGLSIQKQNTDLQKNLKELNALFKQYGSSKKEELVPAILGKLIESYKISGSSVTKEFQNIVETWKILRAPTLPVRANPGNQGVRKAGGIGQAANVLNQDLDIAAARSPYLADQRLRLIMSILQGEWCAKTEGANQLRVVFYDRKGITVGGGVWTFWDIGQPNYILDFGLVPVARIHQLEEKISLLQMDANSQRQNMWSVWLEDSGPVLEMSGNTSNTRYHLEPSCKGFWRCVGDWEKTRSVAVVPHQNRIGSMLFGTPKGDFKLTGNYRKPAVGVGDLITLAMPFTNWEKNSYPIAELYPYVQHTPNWLAPTCSSLIRSYRGTLNKGETTEVPLTFQAISEPLPDPKGDDIQIGLKAFTGKLHPSQLVWHLRSSNAFRTATGECIGYEGGNVTTSFGGFTTSDREPPITELRFKGPAFQDNSGIVIISTSTEIILAASEPMIEDAETSEVKFVGFSLAQTPQALSDLEQFSKPVTLDIGQHFLAIGSSDNFGNTEIIHSIPIMVSTSSPNKDLKPIEGLDFFNLRANLKSKFPTTEYMYHAPAIPLMMTW